MDPGLTQAHFQHHLYDQDRETKQPEKYASAISNHSKRSKERFLYPGTNYKRFSDFLNTNSVRSPGATLQERYAYVIIHDLAYEYKDSRRITEFDAEDGLNDFATFQLPHDGCGQLIFLRGWPSPRWINTIGAKYHMDPEIFRRHLPLGYDQDVFDIPGPPSSSANTVRLKVTTLGKREAATVERQEAKKALQRHFQKLSDGTSAPGQSIVRNFSVHDEEHFSMEQEISVSVLRRGHGWIGLVLLDNGRDLDQGPDSPWLKEPQRIRKLPPMFYPTIQFDAKMCFSQHGLDPREVSGNHHLSFFRHSHTQSAALLPTRLYGAYLSPGVMRKNAFYAMHGLFTFSACSENQFLNCLRNKLDADEKSPPDENDILRDLRNVIYHKSLVRDHMNYLQSVLTFIQCGGGPEWAPCSAQHPKRPTPPTIRLDGSLNLLPIPCSEKTVSTESSSPEASAAKSALLQDYEALFRKACSLLQMYNERIEDMRTGAALHEAREATMQAKFMSRLSFVAFLFIPLSFTTSAFGMNVHELKDNPSIWYWVAISFPVFACSLILFFWTQVRSATNGLRRFLVRLTCHR